ALRGTTVVTVFYEASTRTRASFELAAKVLGADVINLTSSGSSVEKGESLIDTVRTLRAIGADILVMRHSMSGAPYLAAEHCEAQVINAGDGWHAHPSQGLLDLYRAISGVDAVMALRLQNERMATGLIPSVREYSRMYQVNEDRMARARPGAPVLHPGPMNEGVEISAAVAHGSRSLVEEQVA